MKWKTWAWPAKTTATPRTESSPTMSWRPSSPHLHSTAGKCFFANSTAPLADSLTSNQRLFMISLFFSFNLLNQRKNKETKEYLSSAPDVFEQNEIGDLSESGNILGFNEDPSSNNCYLRKVRHCSWGLYKEKENLNQLGLVFCFLVFFFLFFPFRRVLRTSNQETIIKVARLRDCLDVFSGMNNTTIIKHENIHYYNHNMMY